MRRILGAILALALWTSTAHAASTLVIVHETASGNPARGARVQEGYVITALDRMGASYDRVRSTQFQPGATIQNLRRGKYFNGVDTTTYSMIVHVGYRVGGSSSFDSLLLARNYCSVVHVIIGNHMADSGPLNTTAACSTGVGSVAGTADDSSWVTYRVGSPGTRWVQLNGGGACPVTATRLPRGFRPIWGMRSSAHTGTVNSADPVSNFRGYDDSFDGTYPTNPDTTCFWVILNRDTTTAVNAATGVVQSTGTALQFAGQAAAKPTVLVVPTYQYATYAGEATPYIAAIALGDSLSGGALGLSTSPKLPMRMSIHVDDGWKRGDSRNGGTVYGGIEVRDTTYLKASIDSLAALGEKFVLGVEIDSLNSCWLDTTTVMDSCYTIGGSSTTLHTKRTILGNSIPNSGYFYPTLLGKKCSLLGGSGNFTTVTAVGGDSTLTLNEAVNVTLSSSLHTLFWDSTAVGNAMLYDGRWWARAPLAHFTPHCHAGTTTSKGQFQQVQPNAGPYWRMMDLWGTNQRTRIAWGGKRGWNAAMTRYGYGMGQDSSGHALHRRAFGLLDSTFGAGRVDHVAMPPGDDWSSTYNASTGVGNWPLPMTLDSLVFMWDQAGGRGIRTNVASTTSLVSQRIGSYGYYNGPQDYVVTLTADSAQDRRGARGFVVGCPSYPTSASSLAYSRVTSGKGIRAFNSVFYGKINTTNAGVSVTENEGVVAQIIAIHVSDLGGDKWGFPTRPGWLCIKYPVMAARAINAVAATPVLRFVYPEDLQP